MACLCSSPTDLHKAGMITYNNSQMYNNSYRKHLHLGIKSIPFTFWTKRKKLGKELNAEA